MISQLQSKFKNIKYVDKFHQYYNNDTGESLLSVTSLLKKLKPNFDSVFWSTYTSLKRSGYTSLRPDPPFRIIVNDTTFDLNQIQQWDLPVTHNDIRKEWDILSKVGNTLGTYLHNLVEYKMLRKEIDQEIPSFVSSLDSLSAIKYLKTRDILKNMAADFYDEFIQHYIPICTEFVVGDGELGISGTFDLLVQNIETGEIELWDYKTDKQIRYKSDYRTKIKYFNVDDCEFEKYSLQLNIYKYLIERNTDIKISKCKIVHFNHREGIFNIIETKNVYDEVKAFFENDYDKSIYI